MANATTTRRAFFTYEDARAEWPTVELIQSRNGYWRPAAPVCHPDRPYHCGGLCRACYEAQYRATYKRPHLVRCGHPDATYGGRGMCHDCLGKDLAAKRRAAEDPCANHPDRKAWEVIKGQRLCQECLNGAVPDCQHKDRRPRSSGLCDDCEAVKRRKSVRYFDLDMVLWAEYVAGRNECDMCGSPDPGHAKGWNIDHMHGCACQAGSASAWAARRFCAECVRARLCFHCNRLEGHVRDALDRGLITTLDGPMAVLFGPIEDTPFQRWRRMREGAAA